MLTTACLYGIFANICMIDDIEEEDGKTFFVMELVDGTTRSTAQKALSLKQGVEIGIQFANGNHLLINLQSGNQNQRPLALCSNWGAALKK